MVCANTECRAEFVPHNGSQRYCCHGCFRAARKAYMDEMRNQAALQGRDMVLQQGGLQ